MDFTALNLDECRKGNLSSLLDLALLQFPTERIDDFFLEYDQDAELSPEIAILSSLHPDAKHPSNSQLCFISRKKDCEERFEYQMTSNSLTTNASLIVHRHVEGVFLKFGKAFTGDFTDLQDLYIQAELFQESFKTEFEERIDALLDSDFKKIRRNLPLTKTKINW